MTHISDATNGASLEDCHTNFFALADLTGIKWRRLYAENSFSYDILDDPVLSCYAKCLSSGILCVWRRVISQRPTFQNANPPNDGNNQGSCEKELWIFWYGDEPDLTNLVGPNLIDAEQGSWETGLSYECRTLLFKALHNLIEKCLFMKGYTRLGPFFVDTRYSSHHKTSKSSQIAFAFNFFVHGESTVCTSIDVRLAPSVCRLGKHHLISSLSEHSNIKVILSPYGLQGTLTGQSYKQNDPITLKILNEWHHFYPQRKESHGFDIPPLVEVLIGGARVRYPSSYVYIIEQENNSKISVSGRYGVKVAKSGYNRVSKLCPSSNLLTPPSSPDRNWELSETSQKLKTNLAFSTPVLESSAHKFQIDHRKPSIPTVVKLSVQQESSITHSENNDDSSVLWDFQEPSTVLKCRCSKKTSSTLEVPTITIENDYLFGVSPRPTKNERTQAPFIPFHKRQKEELSKVRTKNSSSNDILPNSFNCSQTKTNSVSALVTLPQLHTPLTQPSSVDSHSNIPSVETASCPQIYLSDPIMPTLSPHPPVMVKDEPLQNSENQDVMITHSPNTDIGPTINIKDKAVSEKLLPPSYASLLSYFESAKDAEDSSDNSSKPINSRTNANISNTQYGIGSQKINVHLKRPSLPRNSPSNSENHELMMKGFLYNYDDLDIPFNDLMPNKRKCFHSSDKHWMNSENLYDSVIEKLESISDCNFTAPFSSKDPYEFTDFDETAPSEAFRQHVDIRLKEEEENKCNPIISPITPEAPSPSPKSQNPYTAVEDMKPASFELPLSIPSPMALKNGNQKFIREEDLAVTVHDLDNIFDTSSDDGEEMMLTSSPTKVFSTTDDLSMKSKTSNLTTGFLDLSRMFPTPPSLEQNATPSPLGTVTAETEIIREREITDVRNLLNIDLKECKVFKIPEKAIFDQSWKYAPLPLLSINSGNLNQDKLYYMATWQFRKANQSLTSTPQFETDSTLQKKPDYGSQNKCFTSLEDETAYTSHYVQSQDQYIINPTETNSPMCTASPYKAFCSNEDSMPPPTPEAHGLFMNLLLSDSMLNIFKDHNFDSCALCVCNMNIKGADVGINLPDNLVPSGVNEPQYKCTCGFSAVIYRHRSCDAGLFHEDEYQIFGFNCDERFYKPYNTSSCTESKKKLSTQVSSDVIDLIRVQCKSLFSSLSLFQKPIATSFTNSPLPYSVLQFQDGCDICFSALYAAKNILNNPSQCGLDESQKHLCLHQWPFSFKTAPSSNHETMLQLDHLKPILQESIHKRNTQRIWDMTYVVSGPLTWREFHRLAARGNEDQCELQPVPSLTVGHEKDCVSLSPFALKYWDKLLLEPYYLHRDVAYIIVAPENDFVLANVKSFFRELSSTYELYKLGRHRPITKVLRDGIMRVGRNAAMKLADEPITDWFDQIEDGPLATKLKLYARVCQHRLAPYLSTLPMDKSLLENTLPSTEKSFSNANSPASVDNHDSIPISKSTDYSNFPDGINGGLGTNQMTDFFEDDDQECPAVVIYIVEPFTFSSMDPELCRIVTLGLLECYSQMLKCLPSALQNNINLQLLSLDSILFVDKMERKINKINDLRTLAFSVYTQCHQIFPRQSTVKSLTGFGPAAAQDLFLRNKNGKSPNIFFAYNQPVILASLKDKQTELNEMFGDRREKSGVLFCSYCLTEDKKWLLACCTSDKGELIETTVINIATPARIRAKCFGVRRFGLRKLLDFILEILSNSICAWRIVIGRLGKLGHGELKDWAALLSRKAILSYSRSLRDLCKQCSNMNNTDTPSILSACLVSVFPDPSLRVFPDHFTPDDRTNCNTCTLSTPEDASCTHIYVFPTSATMQSSQSTFHQENGVGGMEDEDLFDVLRVDDDVGQEMNEIFSWAESPNQSPSNSPQHGSPHGSPNASNRHSPFQQGGPNHVSLTSAFETSDDPLQLLAQPLALGYYVSTAKTGPLPKWFWSACPHLANSLPIFLKFALLIHVPAVHQFSDDILHANTNQPNCHPLDSTYTSDVLKFVLESYNSLSWLSLDPSSQDRKSCLPIQIQVLMQLYKIAENLL